jgi:hypothetical protein
MSRLSFWRDWICSSGMKWSPGTRLDSIAGSYKERLPRGFCSLCTHLPVTFSHILIKWCHLLWGPRSWADTCTMVSNLQHHELNKSFFFMNLPASGILYSYKNWLIQMKSNFRESPISLKYLPKNLQYRLKLHKNSTRALPTEILCISLISYLCVLHSNKYTQH